MSLDLEKRYEEILVSMAVRGQQEEYLPPHLWEELRRRLQVIYRKATGEPTATLHVEA